MTDLKDTKELIRELADLLAETNLTEIEFERDDVRIRVARGSSAPQAVAVAPVAAAEPAAEEPAAALEADPASHPGALLSPMVGTAYLAPEPEAPAFVKEGDDVSEGQTVLIIEAMKVMNQIPAPRAGKVIKILVTDSEPIEYDQPLMIIE